MEQQTKYIFDGASCKDLPSCLARFKEGKIGDRFVVCKRGDDFIQACDGKEKDTYDCEVRWHNVLYGSPNCQSWENLIDLMNRFSNGEDLSFVEQSWSPIDLGSSGKSQKIITVAVIIIMILVALFIFARQPS